MTKAIRSVAEKAAQKLYESRVEQATAEYFDCVEKQQGELGMDNTCEMTYQEKLIAHHASFERALKAALDAEKTTQSQEARDFTQRA